MPAASRKEENTRKISKLPKSPSSQPAIPHYVVLSQKLSLEKYKCIEILLKDWEMVMGK